MQELLKKLNIEYKKIELYEQAFVHRSFINENPKFVLGHNERLEFLGDAVLELIVTDFLYRKYPDHNEGDLTAYRAALVNTNSIGAVAQELGFNEHLKLSKGESKDTGRARFSILADTFEAMLGAIYLDLGYERCVKFVEDTIVQNLDSIVRDGLYKDPKSLVQERAQELKQLTPVYKLLSESGPDHDKIFVVGIYFNNDLIAEGEGKSKQLGEIDAAKNALTKLKWIN
jgi:ribonuclease-3